MAFALECTLDKNGIEYSAVTYRVKTLDSLLEKIDRKDYADPFSEIMDLSVVRIVHLYASDFDRIHEMIEYEFQVIEHIDNLAEQGTERFGYSARHFTVQLGDAYAGARYDDLTSLVCEIQVRTALQDAWSIISHHLIYKRESDVPSAMKRRINSLAGLLETADDQFEHLCDERAAYLQRIQESSTDRSVFREEEINADSIRIFLQQLFPSMKLEGYSGSIDVILSRLNRKKTATIGDLSEVIEKTEKACELFYSVHKSRTSAGRLNVALALIDEDYRAKGNWNSEQLKLFRKDEDTLAQKDPNK